MRASNTIDEEVTWDVVYINLPVYSKFRCDCLQGNCVMLISPTVTHIGFRLFTAICLCEHLLLGPPVFHESTYDILYLSYGIDNPMSQLTELL